MGVKIGVGANVCLGGGKNILNINGQLFRKLQEGKIVLGGCFP